MRIPQPFQYQGSKRLLAPTILRYLPCNMERLIEPFAGSAALSLACAVQNRATHYWLNDYNEPLIGLWQHLLTEPGTLAATYAKLWDTGAHGDETESAEAYYAVRDTFNQTHEPELLLYLLARCVKGAVRYNASGAFNQSPDKRRLGTRPETMRQNLESVSYLLAGRTTLTSCDYRAVLQEARVNDIVYMDPPYQGVCGEKDGRYVSGIIFEDFVEALECLNKRKIRYAISYDGRLGERSYGEPLPNHLSLTHIEIEAGRSSQATLLGRDSVTVESLYLSTSLAKELQGAPAFHPQVTATQMALFETEAPYGITP
jgi:DNA adenine methylase